MSSPPKNRSLVTFIASLLGRAPHSRRSPTYADIETLRAKLHGQTDRNRRARETVTSLKARLDTTTAKLDERRHTGLTAHVLAQLLPHKASRRPLLPEDVAAASSREARLLEICEAYRDALATDDRDLAAITRTSIGGLAWWIPLDSRAPQRAERAVAQGFPLRAILQTRELAIGGIMLDLGANIGRTSIPRVMLGDVRAVYAAEPDPNNYACLVSNVVEHGLKGFVLPDRVAIGGRRDDMTLRQSKYSGGHRIMHNAARKPITAVTVAMYPLAEWMARLQIDPDAVSFVKVDTQGSEVEVLKGAASLLARRQAAWQIEVDPGLLAGAGTNVRELVGMVERHFSHFIDISSLSPGPRIQKVTQLGDALAYLGGRAKKTDILAYNGAPDPGEA